MKRTTALVWLVMGLASLAGCDKTPGASPASANPPATSETPTGQKDAEDPKTQTNTGRPDSPKDLKPGTDGNTNPAPSAVPPAQ